MAAPISTEQLPLLELPEGMQRELGVLYLQRGAQKLSLPLASLEIQAWVADQVASVTIKQVFRNSLAEHLEAVYIFPLAAGSAVSAFDMKVGERKIKGVVQERAEARRQYQEALNEGKRAALMEQERDDVFTVQVGNLPPGEEVSIEISYSERLPFFDDGQSELRLPLVVSPRFIPGQALERDQTGDGIELDTDLVPDASRISPPRLAAGVDPNVAVKLKVELMADAEAPPYDLSCSQHATRIGLAEGGLIIELSRQDERLNRDFVLRFRRAADKIKSSLVTYSSRDGETYGILSIMPPKRKGYLGAARDVVFVVDRSGSMQGVKMGSAARACSILLNTLGANDRLAIAAFDHTVEWMPAGSDHFINADTAGIENSEKFLRSIDARGSTEMSLALTQALTALRGRNNSEGRLASIVVLTDGEVGNESQILQLIQNEIGDARLFSVGIDTSVNSGLLKRLANLGGGTATFVEPGAQLEEALASVGREIGAPLVTDVKVENLDLTIDRSSISPARIPDIFAGRASISFLKLSGKGKITVKGRLADGKPFEEKVKARSVDLPAIAQLWAKAHIVDLEDNYRVNSGQKAELKKQIIELAVKHSLLTKFTAFVVVDEAEIVNQSGELRKIVQPVEMPDKWDMDLGQSSQLAAFQAPCASSFGAPSPAPQMSSPPPAADSWGAPAQPGTPFGGQSGSYGMGVRQQVFEVIVRQAMAGAPWQSICQGPMQVNNISASEIEQEVARRMSLLKKDFGQAPPPPPPGDKRKDEIAAVGKSIIEFLKLIDEAFAQLERGQLPAISQLEASRIKLVQTLAPMDLGMELPDLQRFLRHDAIELFACLKDSSIGVAAVNRFWLERKATYELVKAEIKKIVGDNNV